MKNKIISLVIIVLGISLFLNFKPKEKKAVYQEEKPFYGQVQDVVATTGLVQPQNRLEIMPPISGRIEKIMVSEGDNVYTGQTLALMSSTDRAALLDAARTQGEEKVKYWADVYKPTALVAPINGKVIVRSVEPGQTVNANTAVLVLADRLIVKAQVDETDIGRVKIGQKVIITLDAYPDIKISGRVNHISYESKTVNNVTIYDVDIIPDQVPAVFRSGMSANVEIIKLQKNQVLLIPEKAIFYKDSQPQVLLKDKTEKGQHAVEIKTGLAQSGNIEIISGLKETDIILLNKSIQQTGARRTTSFMQRPGQNRRQ